jgi:hypothetical protein
MYCTPGLGQIGRIVKGSSTVSNGGLSLSTEILSRHSVYVQIAPSPYPAAKQPFGVA